MGTELWKRGQVPSAVSLRRQLRSNRAKRVFTCSTLTSEPSFSTHGSFNPQNHLLQPICHSKGHWADCIAAWQPGLLGTVRFEVRVRAFHGLLLLESTNIYVLHTNLYLPMVCGCDTT